MGKVNQDLRLQTIGQTYDTPQACRLATKRSCTEKVTSVTALAKFALWTKAAHSVQHTTFQLVQSSICDQNELMKAWEEVSTHPATMNMRKVRTSA